MAVVGDAFTIDTVAFDLLWERLALGAFPLVLQLRSHGDTFTERHALLDEARARLQADGLLAGTDIHPRLAHCLQVLAHPDDELDVRWRDGTEELRATVVRQDETTVQVVRRNDSLIFTPVTPGSMSSAAVAVLPDVPAATAGGQISAPTEQLSAAYTAAAISVQAGTAALSALGAERANAAALAAALITTAAVSQLGTATTVRGRRVRHPSVIAVLDTGHGRYLSTERPAPDHRLWSTVRPGSHAGLVQAATELLADGRAGAAQVGLGG